jgi:hypothetical protein
VHTKLHNLKERDHFGDLGIARQYNIKMGLKERQLNQYTRKLFMKTVLWSQLIKTFTFFKCYYEMCKCDCRYLYYEGLQYK